MLTILFLGDIVGEPGRTAVITRLPELKEKHRLDFVVVNGENAAGGRGITGKITIDLLRAGVSVVIIGFALKVGRSFGFAAGREAVAVPR